MNEPATQKSIAMIALTLCSLPVLSGCVPADPAQLSGVLIDFIRDVFLSGLAAFLL